jgi:hypothetical protein
MKSSSNGSRTMALASGPSVQRAFKADQASNAGRGGLITSTPTLKKDSGLKRKMSKSFVAIFNIPPHGLKSQRTYPEEQKIPSKTGSTRLSENSLQIKKKKVGQD